MSALRNGSRGQAVRSIQAALNSALRPSPGLTVDGIFGRNTEAAVRAFQAQERISVDGIVGPVTRGKLAAGGERPVAPPRPPIQMGTRGAEVVNLQRLLNAKSTFGPRLATDGVFGVRTQRAVTNFQAGTGLTVSGSADAATMAALEAAPLVRGATSPATTPATPTPPGPVSSTQRPTYANIESVYGDPEDWSYITRITPPFPLYYAGSAVRSVAVHEKVAQSLSLALGQILSHYGIDEIERLRINHNYGGSVNKRLMRGGSSWSTHSWGVAIDLNTTENQFRWTASRALFAQAEYQPMINIFEQNGWYSLGRHRNFDFMHFQAVRI